MKKLFAVSFVMTAAILASVAFASNSEKSEVVKVPQCVASYYTCPDGSSAIKCTRKSGVVHPVCTAADANGCYLITDCR